MDRFVVKKDPKCGRHTTASERHREFKSWTHVSGQILFCTPCNIVLDHKRKSSVEIHSKSQKHQSNLMKPGLDFLKEIRIFNPKNIPFLPRDVCAYAAIPDFADLPQHELTRYVEKLGPSAVREASAGNIDLTVFWRSVSDHVPALAALALRYAFSTCSSADADRSFSLYKLVLPSRRRRLAEDNIKGLVFLHYNKFSDAYFLSRGKTSPMMLFSMTLCLATLFNFVFQQYEVIKASLFRYKMTFFIIFPYSMIMFARKFGRNQ